MKSSTYFFHMKRKTLADFQICISVPLMSNQLLLTILTKSNFTVNAKPSNLFNLANHHSQTFLKIYIILLKSDSHVAEDFCQITLFTSLVRKILTFVWLFF